MGRRALGRLSAPPKQGAAATHERDDGAVGYGGRVVTGAEADYLRAAMGAAKAATTGRASDLTLDESLAMIAERLAAGGVDFATWVRWTLDMMDLYAEGRRLRSERIRESVELIAARARAEKADSALRYSVPLE